MRGGSEDPRGASGGERWYRLLLRLYPASFRDRFGDDMAEFYRDRRRGDERRGWRGALSVWPRLVLDIVAGALLEHAGALAARMRERREARRTGITLNETGDGEMIWSVRQDARYALRGMMRKPTFTAVVLATLALGIGANTAIFSVINGVLLHPLPFKDPDRLVALKHEDPYSQVSDPELVDYKRDAHSFASIAAYTEAETNLTGGDEEPERASLARVSDGFFSVLGAPALLGRTFAPEEETHKVVPVVVISYGLWQRRFGGDPHVVGKALYLSGQQRTVIGVMPRGFDYPEPDIAVWSPLRLNYDSLWTRNNHYLKVVARLKKGASLEQARAELRTIAQRATHDYPDTYAPGKPLVPNAQSMTDAIVGATRPYLLALLGAVGFVLLIACANVANLLLARGESRRKELAIRTALGASRRRLVRQVLTESVLFALVGGALGLVLAWVGTRALVALAPSSIPRLGEVHIDLAVVAFSFAISLATGVLFGLVPALRASRGQSADVLKEGGKTSAQGVGLRQARGLLIVSEVALAVMMLTGAGLMVRSLWKLQQIDLGFTASNVLTMRISLPPSDYSDERSVAFFDALTERVAAMPGVRSAAVTGTLPIQNEDDSRWSIMVDGRVVKNISEAPAPKPQQITADYFRVLGIPIVRGRGITNADRQGGAMVAVVNETMAKQLWPAQDPVGHTIKMFNEKAPWVTVVGVARDVRSGGFQSEVPPTMFFPYAQAGQSAYFTPRAMTLLARTTGDPLALAGAVRAAVRALDRNAPISTVRSMEQIVSGSIASRRFSTTLLAAFATLALVLAGIGIYGVIAYSVSQRSYEIGLRMALGAQRGSVLALVMGQGMRVAIAGLAIGVVGALAAGRVLRSLLVGVTAIDLPTLGAVALALAGVAALATALPARRAMSVSPTEALRGE